MINLRKIGFLICILLTLTVYSNIFMNDFVMDDYNFIVDWPLIRDLNNLPLFFTSQSQPIGEEGVYSPFKTVIHSINYNLWGPNVVGYHVVALIIHLVSLVFVYKISFLLTQSKAVTFITTLLFGVHPVHVEAITSMTGNVDTSGVMFLLMSFYYYVKSYKKKIQKYYIYSILFSFLAIFIHELCISLPLLFLFYDFCFQKRISLKRLSPFFTILAFYVFLKFLILHGVTRGGYLADSFYLTMLVSVKALAKYIVISILPLSLAVNQKISNGIFSVDTEDFSMDAILGQSILDPQVIISLALIISVLSLAIRSWNKNRMIAFCLGWFVIALLPILNIIPASSYFGERYLYPSSFGFCLLLGVCLGPFSKRSEKHLKIIAILVIAGLTVFYSIRTYVRNLDWRNELTFYQNEVRVNPDSFLMQHDMGVIYIRYGQPREALKHFENALKLRPNDASVYFSISEAHINLKEDAEAISALKKAVELDPEFAEGYFNLAGIYARQKNRPKAKQYLRESIKYYGLRGDVDQGLDAQRAFERYYGFGL